MNQTYNEKKCIWCLEKEPNVSFLKKAHTIPKSLGGQNFNPNVCDSCNEYFGNRSSTKEEYSIEEALKETFNITRRRLLTVSSPKRQVGRFKSKYFLIKVRNGKYSLSVKPSFELYSNFQEKICRAFKRGLYKMFFEELDRQKNNGFDPQFDIIRNFARYNIGNLPVFYFERAHGILLLLEREIETPTLLLERMEYLYSDDKFVEIEFLGHVFGFPISKYNMKDFEEYASKSANYKKGLFKGTKTIKKLIDIDLFLNFMNKN